MLINSPANARATRNKVRSATTKSLVLRENEVDNPLEGKLTLTFVSASGRSGGGLALLRLKDGTGEYVARSSQEICRPDGTALAELKGWTLTYAGSKFAVFGDGKRHCYLPLGTN